MEFLFNYDVKNVSKLYKFLQHFRYIICDYYKFDEIFSIVADI